MPLRVRDGRCACVGLHGEASECDISLGIRALASAYALDILDTLARHPVGARFSDLQHDLDLAPNTLARRLHELAANGIVDWTDGSYKLTPAGARLWSGAQALASWRS